MRKEISFDDHYTGSDFSYWGRALIEIANHYGEYINLKMGWYEPFEKGCSPLQAFFDEYPEHKD